jgi:hypothetical protein
MLEALLDFYVEVGLSWDFEGGVFLTLDDGLGGGWGGVVVWVFLEDLVEFALE